MKRFTLSNGLKVILDNRNSNTIVALLTVGVGSNDESEANNGISHFIEHAVFTGTKKRTALEISSAIETLGGEINAGTTPEKTFFYVKMLPKHLTVGLDVLSDIVFNPAFPEKQIETEKRVVAEEIDFVYDDYNFYQWVLFQSKLFKGPQRLPVYGRKEVVLGLTRLQVLEFYNRFYVPNNTVLTLVGSIPKDAKKLIERYFSSYKPVPIHRTLFTEPPQERCIHKVKLPTQSSYIVLGYKIPPRGEPSSLIFDLVDGVLGKGQSGRVFDEVRNKRGLAYSVGCYHYQGYQYNFFALYANLQAKNIPKVSKIFLNELKWLNKLKQKELNEAKAYVEGNFYVSNEENLAWAHTLTQWELASSSFDCLDYVEKVKRVTLSKFKEVSASYLNDNYTLVAIIPKN
ncbi:hypothetical protein DRJ48_01285 [Candidatus Woesearchaeota archaeon]|nr:insulinase family protein [Candidatus Woesearchaeota archaeon]RLE43298.1 MAG: hypothetical protein DRJ48_01285 [Candidatus Woesearchaeota archaeon]